MDNTKIEFSEELVQKAENGDAESQYQLGHCYRIGNHVKRDIEKTIEWYTKAAEQGHTAALRELGLCYLCGEGVKKDEQYGEILLEKASHQRDAKAKKIVADIKRKRILGKIGLVIFIIILGVAIFSVTALIYYPFYEYEESVISQNIVVDAYVEKVKRMRIEDDAWNIYISYSYNGISYETVVTSGKYVEKGSYMQCYIDPDNPNKVFLKSD